MAVEIFPSPDRTRLAPISWPAIFASLAVGVSVMLLLTLAGVAVGVSVVDPGSDSAHAITMGAAAWQTVSMLVAAVVAGFVAARLSGLRRTADGVLHGAVSWGATTVLDAALATTALGTLTAGMFGLLAPPAPERVATATAPAPLAGNREQVQRTLEGLGLTAEQVSGIMAALNTPAAATSPQATPAPAEETAQTVGTATGWLSATVLLSALLSLIGGAMGARGTRRVNRRTEERHAQPAGTADSRDGMLARTTITHS